MTRPAGLALTRRLLLGLLLAAFVALPVAAMAAENDSPRWWKGNTHAHSRWSDGRDFPEMVADWYKSHGYNFLVVTDHNTLQQGEKWADVGKPELAQRLDEYRRRFPDLKVQQREGKDSKTGKPAPTVRVRALDEYRQMFEEPGKFILVSGEEVTDAYAVSKDKKIQVHMNAVNTLDVIPPQHGAGVRETLVNNLAAAAKQEARQKQPLFLTLNHPNWGGVVPVEDFQTVPNLQFFEVLNETLSNVENMGDATRLSADRLWDVALAARLGRLGLGPLYAVAADDSHNIHGTSGGGWIMVRAKALSPESLIAAMRAGDFYASNGVRLKDIRREANKIVVEVDPEAGVTYTIQFIGTIPGYDRGKEDAKDDKGRLLPPTQRYSPDIGKVLQEVKGTEAGYSLTGKELYVRVKVVSSKPARKKDPAQPEAFENAWTQPFVVKE